MNGGARRPSLLVASDFLAALVALGLAYQLRYHLYPPYIPGGVPPDPTHYLLAAPWASTGSGAASSSWMNSSPSWAAWR